MNNKCEKNRYLKAFRKKESLNQGEMAEKLNMSRATYVGKENGRSDFTLSEIKYMASEFKLEIAKINEMFFSDFI